MRFSEGTADANYHLARIYGAGEGVPKDAARAAKYFRLAWYGGSFLASGGGLLDSPMQYDDQAGTAADQRGAAAGDAGAEFSLGERYEMGLGVVSDLSLAAAWYAKAAKQNYPHAKAALERIALYEEMPIEDLRSQLARAMK